MKFNMNKTTILLFSLTGSGLMLLFLESHVLFSSMNCPQETKANEIKFSGKTINMSVHVGKFLRGPTLETDKYLPRSMRDECIKKKAGIFRTVANRPFDFSRMILVTSSNFAYLDILQNWERAADRFGYKWLVIAMDDQIYQHLGPSRAIRSCDESSMKESGFSKEQHFRSAVFNKISSLKLCSVLMLLEKGFDVIFSDPDNVILKDIFRMESELMRMIRLNHFDYLYSANIGGQDRNKQEKQFDRCENIAEREGNTGFYYVSSKHKHIRELFKRALSRCQNQRHLDDQTNFWDELRQTQNLNHCRKVRGPGPDRLLSVDNRSLTGHGNTLTYCCLNPRQYVTGRVDVSKEMDVETYHANFVIGKKQKIAKLKKNVYGGAWFLGG